VKAHLLARQYFSTNWDLKGYKKSKKVFKEKSMGSKANFNNAQGLRGHKAKGWNTGIKT